MPEPFDHTLVAGLLSSLSLRTHAETVVLTARLRPERRGYAVPGEMPDPSAHPPVAGRLSSLPLRTHAETVVRTARLREACGPGSDDRTDALAREWPARSGPVPSNPQTYGCTC